MNMNEDRYILSLDNLTWLRRQWLEKSSLESPISVKLLHLHELCFNLDLKLFGSLQKPLSMNFVWLLKIKLLWSLWMLRFIDLEIKLIWSLGRTLKQMALLSQKLSQEEWRLVVQSLGRSSSVCWSLSSELEESPLKEALSLWQSIEESLSLWRSLLRSLSLNKFENSQQIEEDRGQANNSNAISHAIKLPILANGLDEGAQANLIELRECWYGNRPLNFWTQSNIWVETYKYLIYDHLWFWLRQKVIHVFQPIHRPRL